MPTEQEYINYKDFVDSLDEATPSAEDKAVFNDANGPKGSVFSAIAAFVHNAWAAFVNALTSKTSFVSGDKIPVVNGSTATAMEADKLLELTAQLPLESDKVIKDDLLGAVDIGDSIDGYLRGNGELGYLPTHLFRHFEVPVTIGKTYIVRTRLGTNTVCIGEADSTGLTSGITKILDNTTNPDEYLNYEVTPTKNYLYVSFKVNSGTPDPYTQEDYLAFVVEKQYFVEQIASEITSIKSNAESLANKDLQLKQENLRQALVSSEAICGDSIDGYVVSDGTLDYVGTHLFRHFEVPVTAGKTYIVRTRLGTTTVFIGEADATGLTSGITTILRNADNPDDYLEYEVTPTKAFLYVSFRVNAGTPSPYTQEDYLAYVVEKQYYNKYLASEISDLKTSAISLANKSLQNEHENVRQSNIIGELNIGDSIDGYLQGNGELGYLTTHLFRHFEVPVTPGKTYIVRTRLGTNTVCIGEADSTGLTSGITKILDNTTNPDEYLNYEVTPTKNYLYVSFKVNSGTPSPYTQEDYLAAVWLKPNQEPVIPPEYPNVIDMDEDLIDDRFVITENTIIYGHGHKVTLGTPLTLEFTDDVGECVMAVDSDSDTYKCFVSQTMDLVHSGSRPYNNVTLWAVNDTDITKSKILTPKLTLAEVEETDDSFTYDGTKYIVHCSGHSDIERFVLCPDGDSICCLFNRYHKLKCYDVVFEFAANHCVNTLDSEYCEFIRCEFRYAKVGNGVRATNVSYCKFFECVAHHVNNDGFAPGHLGCYEILDCTGCYCEDDGISNHGDEGETIFVIRGGEYHHNNKGGISSPVYGSIGDITGAHLHHNHFGAYTVGPVPAAQARSNKRTNKISNCVINANNVGVLADGYELTMWNNVLSNTTDKQTANGGVINDYDV